MTVRCDCCGKFAVIVDSYTPFGHSYSEEEPDEVWLCQKCVDKHLDTMRKNDVIFNHWVKAKCEIELAKELGFREIYLPGCAWTIWHRDGEPLPEGYVYYVEEDYDKNRISS